MKNKSNQSVVSVLMRPPCGHNAQLQLEIAVPPRDHGRAQYFNLGVHKLLKHA